MGRGSKASAVLGRWADVCFTGIIGAGAFLLLSPYLGSLHAALHPERTVQPVVFLIALLCVVGPLLWHAGHGRWLASFGVRHFFAYPPAWVGGVFGAGLVLLTEAAIARRSPSDGHLFVQGAAGLLLGVIGLNMAMRGLGFIAERIKRRPLNTGSSASQQDRKRLTLADIVAWFMTDAEVEHPADDWFRRDEIATRIVRRLSDPREDGEAPTMAVVGPLGSGKSTIGRLVEFHASTLKNSEQPRGFTAWPQPKGNK